MTTLVPMDASGRLVLPKAVRDQLHLSGTATFHVEVVGGHVRLTPASLEGTSGLTLKDGMLVIARTGAAVDAAAAVAGDREERAGRAARR